MTADVISLKPSSSERVRAELLLRLHDGFKAEAPREWRRLAKWMNFGQEHVRPADPVGEVHAR